MPRPEGRAGRRDWPGPSSERLLARRSGRLWWRGPGLAVCGHRSARPAVAACVGVGARSDVVMLVARPRRSLPLASVRRLRADSKPRADHVASEFETLPRDTCRFCPNLSRSAGSSPGASPHGQGVGVRGGTAGRLPSRCLRCSAGRGGDEAIRKLMASIGTAGKGSSHWLGNQYVVALAESTDSADRRGPAGHVFDHPLIGAGSLQILDGRSACRRRTSRAARPRRAPEAAERLHRDVALALPQGTDVEQSQRRTIARDTPGRGSEFVGWMPRCMTSIVSLARPACT